jgi:hypothetical protein
MPHCTKTKKNKENKTPWLRAQSVAKKAPRRPYNLRDVTQKNNAKPAHVHGRKYVARPSADVDAISTGIPTCIGRGRGTLSLWDSRMNSLKQLKLKKCTQDGLLDPPYQA